MEFYSLVLTPVYHSRGNGHTSLLLSRLRDERQECMYVTSRAMIIHLNLGLLSHIGVVCLPALSLVYSLHKAPAVWLCRRELVPIDSRHEGDGVVNVIVIGACGATDRFSYFILNQVFVDSIVVMYGQGFLRAKISNPSTLKVVAGSIK